MVSKLGIGGSIIKKDRNLVLLDNTYVLKLLDRNKTRNNFTFSRFAEACGKKTVSNVHHELMEGRLARELMKESQLVNTLSSLSC